MPASAVAHLAAEASGGLIVLVAAFQVALAAGAPWGAAAYGGRFVQGDGRLPLRYRVSSAVAVLALAVAAWPILVAGSVIGPGPVSLPAGVLTATMWALAAAFTLNTMGNLAGQHPVERFGASAVSAALALLCLVVALAR